MSQGGTKNTSNKHKHKRGTGAGSSPAAPSSSPPQDALAVPTVATVPAEGDPAVEMDVFGHYPGDEFIPPAVSDQYKRLGISPLSLIMVHVDKDLKPDKDVSVLPVITKERLQSDIRINARYRVNHAVTSLFKNGLFKAVLTTEGINRIGTDWRMKVAHFDNKVKRFYDHNRWAVSKSLSGILRHNHNSFCDSKGWAMLDQCVALLHHAPTVPSLAEAVVLNPKHRYQLCCVIHAPAYWDPASEVLPNGGLLSWFLRALQGHSLPDIDMISATSSLRQENFHDFPGLQLIRPVHCTNIREARGIVHDGRLLPGGPTKKRNDVHFGCNLPREKDTPSPGAHVTKSIWIFLNLPVALQGGANLGTTLNGVLLSRQAVPLSWCSVLNMATGRYFPSGRRLQGIDLISYNRERARLADAVVAGPINAVDESVTFEQLSRVTGQSTPALSRPHEGAGGDIVERRVFEFRKHGNRLMSTDLWHLTRYFAEEEKQKLSHREVLSIWETLVMAPPGYPARYENFRRTVATVSEDSPTVRVSQSSSSAEGRMQRARDNEEARRKAHSESSCCICLNALIRHEQHWECTRCSSAVAHWTCWKRQTSVQKSRCPVCRQGPENWAIDYARFGIEQHNQSFTEVSRVLHLLIEDDTEMNETKALCMQELLTAVQDFKDSEDPQAEEWLEHNAVPVEVVNDLYANWRQSYQPDQPMSMDLTSRETERYPGDLEDHDPTAASSSAPAFVTTKEQQTIVCSGVRAIRNVDIPPMYPGQPFEFHRSQYIERHIIGGAQTSFLENCRISPVQYIVVFHGDVSVICDHLGDISLEVHSVATDTDGQPIYPADQQDPRRRLPPGKYTFTDCIVCPNAVVTVLADSLIQNEIASEAFLSSEAEEQLFIQTSNANSAYYVSQGVFTLESAGVAPLTLEEIAQRELMWIERRQATAADAGAEARAVQVAESVNPVAFQELLASATTLANDVQVSTEPTPISPRPADPFVDADSQSGITDLHDMVSIRDITTIEEMAFDPHLVMPPQTVLDGVERTGFFGLMPNSPLKVSLLGRCITSTLGVSRQKPSFVSIVGVDFKLLSCVVTTVLQQQEPITTGLQATRVVDRCMGYFRPGPDTACGYLSTWISQDLLLQRLLTGRYEQQSNWKTLEQFFTVHIVATMDHNTRAASNYIHQHGYLLLGGRQPGLPFFCYWFVVCFVGVAVQRLWNPVSPAPMQSDSWDFTSHRITVQSAYNVVCSMMWRALETRTFEFIRLFSELWSQWKWLRVPSIGPDFANPLLEPPDLTVCPAMRTPTDAVRPLMCVCGREFLVGERVCAQCRCDMHGVTHEQRVEALEASDAETEFADPSAPPRGFLPDPEPPTVPPLVFTREQEMVTFLNANPFCVEMLPTFDAELLLQMLRSKSVELQTLCQKMSEDQLTAFLSKFAELPSTRTLQEDRLIMNRIISTALMKGEVRRLAQSRKHKSSGVQSTAPVQRPDGWAWHQRVCDLRSSGDRVELTFGCWHVPWSNDIELARAMCMTLLYSYNFPMMVLTGYKLPPPVHEEFVSIAKAQNFTLVQTSGGNLLRLRFDKHAPNVAVQTILKHESNDRETGLVYEIVYLQLPLAPAIVESEVASQEITLVPDEKGWHCQVCRATWQVDNEPQVQMEQDVTPAMTSSFVQSCGFCPECRDEYPTPTDDGKCTACASQLCIGRLSKSSLRPERHCCTQPVSPGVLSPECVVGVRKQMEIIGKASWCFCIFELGDDAMDPRYRENSELALRSMFRNCLESNVDIACGPAFSALALEKDQTSRSPFVEEPRIAQLPNFAIFDSFLEDILDDEIGAWNEGKRLNVPNAPLTGGTLVANQADPTTFHEGQVTYTLHTPSLRFEEDADLLKGLEPARLTGEALAKSRSTCVFVFHNCTSRHASGTRVKTINMFKKCLKVDTDEVPHEIPEVAVQSNDKMHFAAKNSMQCYGDAGVLSHPNGRVAYDQMITEGAADFFHEFDSVRSYNLEPLDYVVTLISGVQTDMQLKTSFVPFGNVGAFWQHPIVIRLRAFNQANLRKRVGMSSDAYAARMAGRRRRPADSHEETPMHSPRTGAASSTEPQVTSSSAASSSVNPAKSSSTQTSTVPATSRLQASSKAPPGHHGCWQHRDPVATCHECLALYQNREKASAIQQSVQKAGSSSVFTEGTSSSAASSWRPWRPSLRLPAPAPVPPGENFPRSRTPPKVGRFSDIRQVEPHETYVGKSEAIRQTRLSDESRSSKSSGKGMETPRRPAGPPPPYRPHTLAPPPRPRANWRPPVPHGQWGHFCNSNCPFWSDGRGNRTHPW